MLTLWLTVPLLKAHQDQDDHHDKAVEAGQAPLLIRGRKALVDSHYYSVVQWAVGELFEEQAKGDPHTFWRRNDYQEVHTKKGDDRHSLVTLSSAQEV